MEKEPWVFLCLALQLLDALNHQTRGPEVELSRTESLGEGERRA